MHFILKYSLTASAIGLLVSGCVTKPAASDEEVRKLHASADTFGYNNRAPTTSPAVLPDAPGWHDVLHAAFLANGDLEASFREWAMAVHRIDQAGTWPTSNLELGFDYMFSSERMKQFDRTTVSAGLMDPTALPSKTYAAAEIAWHDAQAAGERFRAAKFDLQMRVVQAWADYSLQAERVRIQDQNLNLLKLVSDTAASRVRAGGPQQEQLRADVELRLAENELATARASLTQQRATLNAILRREPNAALAPPTNMPEPRALSATDDQLLSAGISNNAELVALGYDAQSRSAAIERARMEYFPEINLSAAFTGSIAQSIGASIVLPTQLPRIRAMVAESREDLKRVQATAAQLKADRAGRFVVALLAMRDAERRGALFTEQIIPLAERTVELARRGYSAGTGSYLELIDAQRTLLDVRLMSAEARTMRERMLAELEALAGMDVETLSGPAMQEATTQPTEKMP